MPFALSLFVITVDRFTYDGGIVSPNVPAGEYFSWRTFVVMAGSKSEALAAISSDLPPPTAAEARQLQESRRMNELRSDDGLYRIQVTANSSRYVAFQSGIWGCLEPTPREAVGVG